FGMSQPTVVFFPEGAFGPTNNCIGIGRALQELGVRVVFVVEESFGPALPVFRVKDLDEAIEKANRSEYGLGSSIWTRNLANAYKATERIQAGNVWINSLHYGYDEMPFGGVKSSGIGREHGPEALEYYFETKGVVVAVS
ncbi:MAG: hypothetical protein C4321_01420, partial [Chloroflexota bacterium]